MKKSTKIWSKVMSNKYILILLGAAAGATSVYVYKEHKHNEEIDQINNYYMNEIADLNCKHEEECMQNFKDVENSMRKEYLKLAGRA